MGQMSFDFGNVFTRPGPLTVAYGMGVDSTAMLVAMVERDIKPDLITFADTGAEHPDTYRYFPIINAYLQAHGFPTVTAVRYVPKRFKNGRYSTITGNCLVNKTLPSLAFGRKSCSLKWKAAPQERYITKHWAPGVSAVAEEIPIRRCIGYDAGTKDAVRGAVKPNPQFEYLYPLQIWGYDREQCKSLIQKAGLPEPPKSACIFCPSTKPEELIALAKDYPDLAAQAIAIEDRARPRLKKIKGLWRNGTKTRAGSWRAFLTSRGLLPNIQLRHYREPNETHLPKPCHEESLPYLHIGHYHAKPELLEVFAPMEV